MGGHRDSHWEEQWEHAAFRWVLGLGALTGAWWTVFGLLELQALAAGKFSLAAPILVVALLAGVVPVRRALRVDPIAALRNE